MFRGNHLCLGLWPLTLVLSLGITEKSPAPFSFHPPLRYLWTLLRPLPSEPSLLQAEVPALSDSSHRRDAPVCHLVALHWTLSSARSPSGWQQDPVGESATPPSFVLSAELLRLHPAPPFRSPLRMLKSTGPKITPHVHDQLLTCSYTSLSSARGPSQAGSPQLTSPAPHPTQTSAAPPQGPYSKPCQKPSWNPGTWYTLLSLVCQVSHLTTEHIS